MQLVYILYDSISNSIFASQVWQPLLIHAINFKKIKIISFETKPIKHSFKDHKIEIIQIKRYKYLGKINLITDYFKIKKILPKTDFKIIARGPFSGWIAKQMSKNEFCKKITIQARGLAAAEYKYSKQSKNYLNNFLVSLRTRQLFNLEKNVYATKHPKIFFECVSKALKDYLNQQHNLDKSKTKIAQIDLPIKTNKNQIKTWRVSTRNKLNIDKKTIVYCYSGSALKWQYPKQTVDLFKLKLQQNEKSFLLILTKDYKAFEKVVLNAQIPSKKYLIISVPHSQIYQYLSAADYGLIIREKHILNWVSRPTKAIEYQSIGLKVIHNDTIEWLVNYYHSYPSTQQYTQ